MARLAAMNNRALVEAFEDAGLTFVAEDGGGLGLRFEKKSRSGDVNERLRRNA